MKNSIITTGFATIVLTVTLSSSIVCAQYTDFISIDHIYARGEPILLEDGMKAVNKDLRGVHIHRIIKNADFSDSDLSRADLREAGFENCSFNGANLSSIMAYDAYFTDCDFTGAVINGARDIRITKEQLLSTDSFQKKNLSGISLNVNDLSNVDFSGFDMKHSSFGRNLAGCRFDDTQVEGAHLPGFNLFSIEQFQSTWDFKHKTLIGVSLELDLAGLDLSRFNLTKCTFESRTNFKDVDFTDAVITQCHFNGGNNLTLEQIKSTWNYKTGNMAQGKWTGSNHVRGIKLPKEIQDALDAEKEANSE